LVFTASLLEVQHLKRLVWRLAGKFACCYVDVNREKIAFDFLNIGAWPSG